MSLKVAKIERAKSRFFFFPVAWEEKSVGGATASCWGGLPLSMEGVGLHPLSPSAWSPALSVRPKDLGFFGGPL